VYDDERPAPRPDDAPSADACSTDPAASGAGRDLDGPWSDPQSREPVPDPPPPGRGTWPSPAPRRAGVAALAAERAPRTHRWGIPAFLLAEAVFLLTSIVVGFALFTEAPDGTPQFGVAAFLAATTVPTVAAAAVALLVTRLRGNGPRIDLGLRWTARDVGIGLGLGFAGLFVSTAAAALWVSIVGPTVGSAVGDALAGLRAPWPLALAVVVAVVVVAPVCEEILYRGLLWGAVEKLGAGPWLAYGVTTVVFALAHLEVLRAPLLLVVALPIGLARLITGRLPASIVAHAFNNLLPGVAVFLMLVGVELPAPT
jgi:membrane protease YdiL (CAAX protease family)